MATYKKARSRGHEIEVTVDDDGTPTVTVDGEDVPVRAVKGGYAVTYHPAVPDLLQAAKNYIRTLQRV